jgi:hypothetical protein
MNIAATAPPALEATAVPKEKDAGNESSDFSLPEADLLHADYFDQIMPAPPAVCGRQLKVLSIGRYRLMSRFKVAFVAEREGVATAGDLLMGVLICSFSCEEFSEMVSTPNFKSQVQKWGRKMGFFPPRCFSWPMVGKWLHRNIGRVVDEADAQYLLEQTAIFQQYIKDGSKTPPYWDESPGERVSGAHWSQSIEAVLREFQGWTKQEIDEEPLTKALWDYFKHMENQGMVRLMTDDERRESEKPLAPEKAAEISAWLKKIREAQNPTHGQ